MVDDRLTIGDELDVRVHRARVVGLLHIQPGWTGDVNLGRVRRVGRRGRCGLLSRPENWDDRRESGMGRVAVPGAMRPTYHDDPVKADRCC